LKRKSQPKKLIRAGAPSHGLEFEDFSKLIPAKEFEKIEKILGIASPLDEFRHSLARFLWSFYRNSLPEAEIKFSRAVLVRKLRKSADCAEELEKFAEELWASENDTVIGELREFRSVGLDWQSSRPLHRSGVAFVGVLSAYAFKTRWLAQALPADPGGPRHAMPFDRLVMCLGDYYSQLTGEEPLATTQVRFFRFICAVLDVLHTIEKNLPAARFRLPKNDNALRTRVYRLAKSFRT
jgi:hypothetical protein